MSAITTHVLDTAGGRPAAGVEVTLERQQGGGWSVLATGVTDGDGRITDLLPPGPIEAGTYRLTFATGAWHAARGIEAFHPEISITFSVRDGSEHYHVPVLLAPFGFTTYRGS
ncbi:MAG: hydroxyisourate hydrolase [Deltaproteobacteria bacterium]|nr:MAG: hydroxyisourate hydrolase [Deltaproteobacteria bacterium]